MLPSPFLAKKARTPPPPRRPVQARSSETLRGRRRREAHVPLRARVRRARHPPARRRARRVRVRRRGGSSASSSLINTSSCTEQQFPGLKPQHINNPDANVNYNSFPPSSGPHYAQPAPWGIYPDSIKQTILVHNLEHGGIVIQYGTGVSKDDVNKLAVLLPGRPVRARRRAVPKLGNKIAATAWNEPAYDQNQDANFNKVDPGHGFVLMCKSFDKGALSKFRDKRRNKAGERYPSVKDMAPGQ